MLRFVLIAFAGTAFVSFWADVARSDILRWDNGDVISGLTPNPGVNLDGLDLSYANLGNATLFSASLVNTNLTRAYLYYAVLSNANLTGANLSRANLEFTRFQLATLNNVDFSSARVERAVLSDTTSTGFTKEQLYSTNSYQRKSLYGISLVRNDLAGWNFSSQDLSGAFFIGATLNGADFSDAIIERTSFSHTTLTGFTKEQLYSTRSYRERNLQWIDLNENEMPRWDFHGQDLMFAFLSDSRLINADFTSANLSYVKWKNSDLTRADLRGATGFSPELPITVRSTILPDGTVNGINLGPDVRMNASPYVPEIPIRIVGQFAISPNSTFDLTKNVVIVNTGDATASAAQIRNLLISGRDGMGIGGTWTGTGITSSIAAVANQRDPDAYSVGYAENAALPLGAYHTFHGAPVDDTTILIAFTRTGDANLDGIVDNNDVTIVGANYAPGVPKPEWALGDFDYNGFVDNDDVTLLGAFYDPSAAPLIGPASAQAGSLSAVPEPAAGMHLAGAVLCSAVWALAFFRRRRR